MPWLGVALTVLFPPSMILLVRWKRDGHISVVIAYLALLGLRCREKNGNEEQTTFFCILIRSFGFDVWFIGFKLTSNLIGITNSVSFGVFMGVCFLNNKLWRI